jgi:hypothetical protein
VSNVPEFLDFVVFAASGGAGALLGSLFMWLVIGPVVLKRAAPRIVRGVLQDVAHLTDKEITEADGDMFKAMTKKQGDSFAQAVNGALGNLIQAKPDEELEKLARQYGFEGVDDAKAKILGNGIDGQLGANLAQANPTNVLGALGALGGNGGNNRFAGIVDAIALIQSLGALGGGNALPGMPGVGNARSQMW